MPRNGSGVYSTPGGTAAVSGQDISSTAYNSLVADIGSEITGSVPRAGTAAMTGALQMGGYKVTNAGDGTVVTDVSTVKQLLQGALPWADGGGTGDAITATYSPAVAALVDGMRLRVRATAANTVTTPTFSPNGLTARTIVKLNGTALAVGDIAGDGHELVLVYDATNTRWALINPATPSITTLALTALDINGASAITDVDEAGDFVPLYDLSGTANKKALARYIGAGLQTISIPAAALAPRTTNGAAQGSGETSTNKIMRRTLDFDAATAEYAQIAIRMPKGWNESTVDVVFQWSHPSTTTNFDVVWGVQAVAISDQDALDAAFGAASTVTDSGGTTDTLYHSSKASGVVVGGSPAAGDVVVFQVYRDAAAGGDTLAVDARLHGVTILYTTDANTDD